VKKDETWVTLSIDGHYVRITHPDKLYFSKQVKLTKLYLIHYYLSVAPGALRGIQDRWPKTSGSRGMHVNVRIEPRWTFTEVRRAALALSRAVERRVPALASSKWWKEERHGVFLDYNQNAKDRTTSSANSVRPLLDARVSAPREWHEVSNCNPADFTVLTMSHRFATVGDPTRRWILRQALSNDFSSLQPAIRPKA
jgi:DNA primase